RAWRDPVIAASLALIAVLGLSIAYTSVAARLGWRDLLGHRELLLLGVFMYVCQAPRTARAALWGLALGSAASLVASLGMAASGHLMLNAVPGNYMAFKTHTYHNLFVGLLGLCALAAALRVQDLKRRIALGVLFALCAVDVLLLVLGRTTQLTFVMLLGLLALMLVNRPWQRAAMLCGAALLIVAVALQPRVQQRYLMAVHEAEGYADGSHAETSIGLRLSFWQNTLKIIQKAPLLGMGLGSFRAEYEKVKPPDMPNYGNPHSDYLLVWAENGLLGLGFFLAWIVVIARRVRRVHDDVRFLAAAAVFSMVVASLANSFFTDFTTGMAFVFTLGAVLGYRPRGSA
ncbi:MAG: O-antigen ligase family protein, partial [Betaproteobacteria bacterium]|nr:O-antigen ligase family protein [Betaproteobacteria bacterium]